MVQINVSPETGGWGSVPRSHVDAGNNSNDIDMRYSGSAKRAIQPMKKRTKKREEASYYHYAEEDGQLGLAHFTYTTTSGSKQ